MTERAELEAWKKKQREFQGRYGSPPMPSRPKGLSDRWNQVWDDLEARAHADGPDYNEVVHLLHDIADEAKAHVEANQPPGPVTQRTEYIGAARRGSPSSHIGRAVREERDAHGRLVSQEVLSREDTDAMREQIKGRVDAREAIRDMRIRGKEIRQLANMNEQGGATTAAESLRAEAAQLDREASARMEMLKASTPPELWKASDLGPAPSPLLDGVKDAVAAITAGQHDVAIGIVDGIGGGKPKGHGVRGGQEQHQQAFLYEVRQQLARELGDREAEHMFEEVIKAVEGGEE